jgi:hypothetical protein
MNKGPESREPFLWRTGVAAERAFLEKNFTKFWRNHGFQFDIPLFPMINRAQWEEVVIWGLKWES